MVQGIVLILDLVWYLNLMVGCCFYRRLMPSRPFRSLLSPLLPPLPPPPCRPPPLPAPSRRIQAQEHRQAQPMARARHRPRSGSTTPSARWPEVSASPLSRGGDGKQVSLGRGE